MATALDSTVLKHRVSADCLDSSHFYILWRVLNLVLSPWRARSLEDLTFRKMLKGPVHAVVVSGPPVCEKPCTQALAECPGSLWGCLPRLSALHPVQTRVLLPPHSELWAQGSGLPLCYWLFLVLGWGVKLVSCSLLSPKSPWSSSHLATQPEFYYLQTNTKFSTLLRTWWITTAQILHLCSWEKGSWRGQKLSFVLHLSKFPKILGFICMVLNALVP